MEGKLPLILTITFLLKTNNITQTTDKLDENYRDLKSISIVEKWFTEFRCGCTGRSGVETSKPPNEVVIPRIIEKIHEMVLTDRRLKMFKIMEAIAYHMAHWFRF